MQTLLLIDGYSLIHRAFYAIPLLSNPQGQYTNAVFGFYNMLLKAITDAKPDFVCVALDAHAKTFRHEKFDDYKGTRKPMPDELRPQTTLLRQTLADVGISHIELAGYEADDIIGTLARQASEQGIRSVIVTGDRDSLQLVSADVSVWLTKKGISDIECVTPASLLAQYSLRPEQVIDLKALMGDSSDNIPGIAGIGEKTAMKLLAQYDNLDNVLQNAHSIKGKLGERLQGGRQAAELSRWLATIDQHVPISFGKDEMRLPPLANLAPVFQALNFKSLLERLPRDAVASAQAAAAAPSAWKEATAVDDPEGLLRFLGREPEEFALFEEEGALYLAFAGGDSAIVSMQGDLLTPGIDELSVYQALAPLLASPCKKRLFDSKALRTKLALFGLELSGEVFDAGLALYLLSPGIAKTPGALLAGRGLPITGGAFFDVCTTLYEELAQTGMKTLYDSIELPLASVLFQMEQAGFRVDRDMLYTLQKKFGDALQETLAQIYELVGEQFNVNSSQQLAVVLFDQLGLPPGKKTSRGYSTDAEVLEALQDQHPVVPLVLKYRSISKLKSTYVDSLLKLGGEEGIIHTTLHQNVTVTGRISSAEPNLQNIPVRTPLGRVLRKVFVPRKEGLVLVDADYSQIELRVLAHMAGEENMIRAFQSGEDIHRATAAQVYGVPLGEVSEQMRSGAKAVNFGIVYGISDFGLAKNIGVSRKEAAEFIERYFSKYPAIRTFMEGCKTTGKEKGYVQTMFGRRRMLPELSSSNFNTRSFGERAAMNAPIQGTAADIIKIAMIRVSQALQNEHLSARLILQVHDELIIEAPAEEASQVEALLVREMQGAATLSVPLVADVKTGLSWYETK